MRLLVVALGIFVAGCYTDMSIQYQVTASARFESGSRPAVWSRALSAFQFRGALIAMTDPVGGLLRTEVQPSWVRCGNTRERACFTREHDQLTIGADGTAFLRRYVVANGSLRWLAKSPFTPEEWSTVQRECKNFIDYIVGTSGEVPRPPPPTREGLLSL